MHKRHFNTVSELLAAEPSPANREKAEGQRKRVDSGAEKAWYGVSSMAEAKKVLLGGWEEGLERIRQTLSKLQLPQIESIRRRPVWRDSGDDLSLDRVYSGELDTAWRTTERRSSPPGLRPCHKIMVCVGGGYKLPAEAFFWRGAVAVSLSDALEESGRSCEIVAYGLTRSLAASARKCDRWMADSLVSVTLKQADEPLHLSRVAAMTAHAAAHRIAIFRGEYAAPFKVRDGMGWSILAQDPPTKGEEPCLVIRDIFSEQQARTFLAKVTGQIGG